MNREQLEIKIANEAAEFAQIAQLNYATFVEEIPQHQTNPDRALVDKFHQENLYFIAKVGHNIVGMLALRSQRPFHWMRSCRIWTILLNHMSRCVKSACSPLSLTIGIAAC